MPRVSVIVPNYNHSRYLKRRLNSVYEQLYRDFEVVILDDCSSDESLTVIEPYLARPNTLFSASELNSGNVFRQWERGIAHSSGELLWIAESDDAASTHFLSTLVPVLESDPRLGVAYAQSWMIDLDGRINSDAAAWTADLSRTRWLTDFRNEGIDEIRDFLVYKNTIPNASAVLFRRKALDDAGGVIKEAMRLCGDWLQWVRMLKSCRIAYSAHRLNYWRQNSSNVRLQSNGILEWEEGQFIIDEVCAAAGIPDCKRLYLRQKLLDQCMLWQNSWRASSTR